MKERRTKTEAKTKVQYLTDAEVEKEISELIESPNVLLAKKEERIRLRRRILLSQLRSYEKKGKELAEAGVTMEILEQLNKECGKND